jgi:hypothetical protein
MYGRPTGQIQIPFLEGSERLDGIAGQSVLLQVPTVHPVDVDAGVFGVEGGDG